MGAPSQTRTTSGGFLPSLGRVGIIAMLMVLGASAAASAQAARQGLSTFLVGRDGWVHEGDAWQGILRVELVEPESQQVRPAGFIVLACDRRGQRLYFSIAGRSRQRRPDTLADGFAHFVLPEDPSSRRVSLYVTFEGDMSFRSVPTLATRAGGVNDLIDLFSMVERQAFLFLRPRPPQRGFRRDEDIRLIFEPGPGLSGLPMSEALLAYATDCRSRR